MIVVKAILVREVINCGIKDGKIFSKMLSSALKILAREGGSSQSFLPQYVGNVSDSQS